MHLELEENYVVRINFITTDSSKPTGPQVVFSCDVLPLEYVESRGKWEESGTPAETLQYIQCAQTAGVDVFETAYQHLLTMDKFAGFRIVE